MKSCAKCGQVESRPGKALPVCGSCQKPYCSEHIYSGEAGYDFVCKDCLDEHLAQKGRASLRSPAPLRSSGTDSEDVWSMTSSDPFAPTSRSIPRRSPPAAVPPRNEPSEKARPRYEYRSITVDLQRAYPVQSIEGTKIQNLPEPLPVQDVPLSWDVGFLNSLGDDGWHVISVTPVQTSSLMLHKESKSFLGSGGMTDKLLVLLEREVEE